MDNGRTRIILFSILCKNLDSLLKLDPENEKTVYVQNNFVVRISNDSCHSRKKIISHIGGIR